MIKLRIKKKLIQIYEFFFEIHRRVVREQKYRLHTRRYRLNIMTFEETIDYIESSKCSISRFGDGEFDMILGTRNLKFQKYSHELAKELLEVLSNNNSQLLLCIPGTFNTIKGCNWHAAMYWTRWAIEENSLEPIVRLLKKRPGKKYRFGNAQITRPYMDWESKKNAENTFTRLKKLWLNKDILILEGSQTRLGVGNDLFSNAKSIKRIIAPAENSFECYEKIKNKVLEFYKGELVIAALGPTATILASELASLNIRTLDIGHIDIEYEWFLNGTKEKIKIEGKYVNEVIGGQEVIECKDEEYCKQIVARVEKE